ncbi:homocysteine S-methyltransferase family protein [Vibrio sp. JC009]|uniref:homocysteine S-methyltransferase family protein n=1 Tax=Vibrio sp. JC009 TaxID=2912314 RepID=UPI0023B1E3F2|nr:homocysteine S-methyltransferase family protein [Vibrio sp. JC009]WED21882.1 homocysteine S-methyltransferase family protein [Vibrio sp. JC009]
MSDKQAITILDGGMGRELERRGAPFRQPEWSALAMMETPELVADVHKSFIRSGAQLIMTNSYALVPFHIGEERFAEQAQTLADLSGSVAREASEAEGKNTLVAGSIPPLFGSYRADLYQPERAEEIATPLINGLAPYVDVWIAETQSLIEESVAVHNLVSKLDKEKKPFWVSFTLEDSIATEQPVLRSGESVEDAVEKMVELNVTAILFNCSQPEVIEEGLKVAHRTLAKLDALHIELGAYANAFPPQSKDATANDGLDEFRDDLNENAYLEMAKKWQKQGATLIGGCCGIGPEYIEKLSQHFHAE